MISSFQSREFSFGFSWDYLSDDDLNRINYFRSEKTYMDKDAAKLLWNGSALKQNLSREYNPFLVMFEYENSYNKQLYWRYEHLVLQIKYCLDCLKVLYPSFDFVFIFDHLCCHDQSHEGRLKSSIMIKYFGGKHPNMRDTIMLGGGLFFGPYYRILETGNTQHMWWEPALPSV